MKRLLFIFLLSIIQLFLFGSIPGIGDTIHVVHYDIHLDEINTSQQTIRGHTIVRCVSLVEELSYIPLELKDLTVDSVLVDGEAMPFIHAGDVVRTTLPGIMGSGDTATLDLYYGGEPFHESWGGFHFSGNYAFNLGVGFVSIPHNLGKTWFPCVDNFTDRATYDFYITVEEGLSAICGGILQELTEEEDGRQTWHWKLDRPIPTYLASVAVGEYLLYSDQFAGIEDTIPITIYVRPQDIEKVEGSFVHLKEVMEWYEQRFGPYPFGRIGYVSTAIGAMEHAANIAYPHSAINGNTASESLLVHELAHMWVGDMVTCSTAEDMWLNEGWATFCALLYVQDLYGESQFMDELRYDQREVMRKAHITDGGYFALNNIPQEVTYGDHAYKKGGLVAYTLKSYLGDSLFFETIAAYLQHYAYQSVSSEQMRDFIASYSGIAVDAFFDAWVFTPGTPHFSIDSVRFKGEEGTYSADIWLRQKYKGAEELADENHLEVTFVDENFNAYTDTVHFSGRSGHSVKEGIPFLPAAAFLDLHEKVCDASTEEYRYFNTTQESKFTEAYFKLIIEEISDSVLFRVGHHWVAPDSLKSDIPGVRLSPSRYWKIEGVFPGTFSAKGQFTYDIGNYLDNGLITSSNDSVVILYRQDPGKEWEEKAQVRYGSWDFGVVEVEELMPGEYTLATWDKQVVSQQEFTEKQLYRIYPNPAREAINFDFREAGKYQITIYDSLGAELSHLNVNGHSKTWRAKQGIKAGSTVIIRISQANKVLGVEKVVLMNGR